MRAVHGKVTELQWFQAAEQLHPMASVAVIHKEDTVVPDLAADNAGLAAAALHASPSLKGATAALCPPRMKSCACPTWNLHHSI